MNWHTIHEKCLTRMFKWTHRAFSSVRHNFPPYLMSIMGTHFRFINTSRVPMKTNKYSTEQVNFESRDYIYENISPVIFIYRYQLQVQFLLGTVHKLRNQKNCRSLSPRRNHMKSAVSPVTTFLLSGFAATTKK